MILSGRGTNDGMGWYVACRLVKLMFELGLKVNVGRALIMGLMFKENCPDLRNTRVVDVIEELKSYNVNVDVYDPWVSPAEAEHEYGIKPIHQPEQGVYDAVLLAVAHNEFRDMGVEGIRAFGKDNSVLYDVKHVLPPGDVDGRL